MTPPDEPAGPHRAPDPAPVDPRLDLDAIEAELDAIEQHLGQLDEQPATPGPDRA